MTSHLLTEEQVAEMLHVSKAYVQRLCRANRIAYVQVKPRQRVFLPEHVEDYIRSKTITPPKRIDTPAVNRLPLPRKGGGARKSLGDMERARLRKELAQCR